MQERRVCVTKVQSHKKYHCNVTNRGLQRRSSYAAFAAANWRKPIARGNEVRLDICAQGFWEVSQEAFSVRVFNPNATRYAKLEL